MPEAAAPEAGVYVEITITVRPDEVVLISVAAAEDPRVRTLRPLAHSYLDRLRLGEAVGTAVVTRARADAGLVRRTLSPLAARHADASTVDGYAMNTRFLVARADVDDFLDCVADLHDRLRPRCEVRASVPLPPHSFTESAG
jgi:hypothetical protein